MRIGAILLCAAMAGPMSSFADPAPYPITVDSQLTTVPTIDVYQGEGRTIRATFIDGGAASDVSASTPFMWIAQSLQSTQYITSAWARVSGLTGVVDFTFSAVALNTNTEARTNFVYGVGAGATYRHGSIVIRKNPRTSGDPGPTYTVQTNLSGVSFVNYPWPDSAVGYESTSNHAAIVGNSVVVYFRTNYSSITAPADGATNAIGSARLALSYTAATRTVYGSVDVSGLATGSPIYSIAGLATGTPIYSVAGLATGSPVYSIAGLATGTPVYAESGITSGVAQGQTANMSITGDAARRLYFTVTGLATGTPIYSVAGLATGSPLYAESDSAAISQVGAASNSLRASVDGATTNIAALSNAALSAIGMVATNLNAASNALASSVTTVQAADVARASGISNSIASLTGVYLQRSNNLSDVLSAATARGNLGLGTAATNSFTNAIYGAGTIFGLAVSTNTAAAASIPVRGAASTLHPMTLGGDVSAGVSGATQLTVTVGAGAITWSKLDSNTVDAVLARDAELTTNAARIAVLETNTFTLAAGLLVGVAASNAQVVASNVYDQISGAPMTNARLTRSAASDIVASFLTSNYTNGMISVPAGGDYMTIYGGDGSESGPYSSMSMYPQGIYFDPNGSTGPGALSIENFDTGSARRTITLYNARLVQIGGSGPQTSVLGRVYADGIGISNIQADFITGGTFASTALVMSAWATASNNTPAAWSSNAATTAVNMHTNQLLQVSGVSFVLNSTTTTPFSLRVQTANTLQYINSTGTGSTIIRSDNLSAQGVQTVAGYNSSITNYWRIVSTAPTSANASGSRGDLHVSGTNAFAYDGSAWFRWAATTNW